MARVKSNSGNIMPNLLTLPRSIAKIDTNVVRFIHSYKLQWYFPSLENCNYVLNEVLIVELYMSY